MTFPKVTVATIVYNDAPALRATLASVRNQQYANMEYVLVDGGSTDGTELVLQEYAGDFAYCISEPDHGTYDAMNKALVHAKGDWIIFMNAGDCFYDNQVLNRVFSRRYADDVAIIGGDIMAYSNLGLQTLLKAPGRACSHRSIMPCSHQAAFIRREVHVGHRYDYAAFPICADYACMCSILDAGYRFQYVDTTIAWFNVDGVSSRKCYQAMLESRKIPHVVKRPLSAYIRAMLYEWKQAVISKLPAPIRFSLQRGHLQKNGWLPISSDDKGKLPLVEY